MVKLLANENFPKKSTDYLRKKCFDIVAVGEEYAGIEDANVMALADQQNRTIITFDRDYGELIFKHKLRLEPGIIYLRLEKFRTDEPGKLIHEILSKGGIDLKFRFTVIDEKGIRQRKY